MSVSDLRLAATVGLYLIAKRRREEAEERKQEWIDRSLDKLTRWGEFHERNVESIQKLLLNKEKLDEMLEAARSDGRRERVMAWHAENREEVQSLERRNADLLGKIRDLQARLQDAGVRNTHVPLTISVFGALTSPLGLRRSSALRTPVLRTSASISALSTASRVARNRR